MPRDLPIGNERLLVLFDDDCVLRDLYYPNVGKENHAGGYPFRFGVFVDGRFSWLKRDDGWRIDRRYERDTLVTDVRCAHERLQLTLQLGDCVDFHETVLIRRVVVKNHAAAEREIRLFFHHDFRISESDVGDTAAYDPATRTITHYKGFRYFLANLMVDGQAGIEWFATGQKGAPGRDGTWRDAEDDGNLGMNPIAQGAVDSVASAHVRVPAHGEKVVYYWLVCAKQWEGAWDGAKEVNHKIVQRGPEAFIARTRAYWKLWVEKEPTEFFGLPPSVVDLYKRSLLIIATHVDEGGGIVAANDSDIIHFARDTYSYVWPRDGALVSHALDMAGYPDLTRKFFQFCADVITPQGYLLHKYNPNKSLASSWHPWVGAAIHAAGGKTQADLKLGPPQLPIQEDETALVVWAMWRHFQRYRDLGTMKPLYGRLIRKAADFMVGYREPQTRLPAPSYDLWEERRGILTYTCGAVYGGLMAAAEFANAFGDTEHAARYADAAKEIRQGMDRFLWRPELGRFARMINVSEGGAIDIDPVIDSSLSGAFAFGAYAPDDPKIEATMRAIRQRLWCKTEVGGIARYEGDYYHAVSSDVSNVPGNPWFICTLWLAQHVIAKARTVEDLAEAVNILEWVDAHKLDSGVLAEQVNPYTNAPLSVSPLTWSHATVVEVVQSYLEKRESVERCPTCGGPKRRKIEGYELCEHPDQLPHSH
jgi:GH15 family glucan-1,4-alpha-glucosidase